MTIYLKKAAEAKASNAARKGKKDQHQWVKGGGHFKRGRTRSN